MKTDIYNDSGLNGIVIVYLGGRLSQFIKGSIECLGIYKGG